MTNPYLLPKLIGFFLHIGKQSYHQLDTKPKTSASPQPKKNRLRKNPIVKSNTATEHTKMSSSQSNSNTSSPANTDNEQIASPPMTITQQKAPRKVRADKGKKRKIKKSKSSASSASEADTDISADEFIEPPMTVPSLGSPHLDEPAIVDVAPDDTGVVVEPVEIASSSMTSAEIIAEKGGKKGSKYHEDEVDIVRKIVNTNSENVVLTARQLEIAYWIESERIKGFNKTREDGVKIKKSDKASCAFEASCDKPFFLEIQRQYLQEDGTIYTLQAFQHAINHWFFEHFNKGNALARSKGYLDINVKNNKAVGLKNVPLGFFETEFLGGFLNTEDGKHYLEIGEEAQRTKRNVNKSVKGTNKTAEQRSKNIKNATENMEDDELEKQIAMMMAIKAKRDQAKVNDKQCRNCEIEAKKHCDECGGYGSDNE